MRTRMDWPAVALEWVNCLRLTENPLNNIKELGDGKFLCEVLQILFRKTVNIKNKAQVFHILKESLIDLYTPSNWINFEDAYEGNAEELVKIVSVLIGVGSLQSEEKLFLENPSNYLSNEAQVHLTKFLESVLENGKIVDAGFVWNTEDKENEEEGILDGKCVTPKVLFPYNNNNIGARNKIKRTPPVLESPQVYVSSPLPEFLSSSVLEAERLLISEKNNEISALKNRIDVLTACQRDLMEDINSYKEESSKANQRCDDLEKENQSLRLLGNNASSSIGTPNPETPGKVRTAATHLRDRLKRSENYVDVLETKIDESGCKIRKLEEEIAAMKKTLQQASLREVEMMREKEKDENEKMSLRQEIDDKHEIVRKLTQEIEDYRDTQQMNTTPPGYNQDHGSSGILGLSICDSFNASACCKPHGLSTCEDMASAVIEVQLRETQTHLRDTEDKLADIELHYKESLGKLDDSKQQLNDALLKLEGTEAKLQDTVATLKATEDKLADTELQFKDSLGEVDTMKQQLNDAEVKLQGTVKESEMQLALLPDQRLLNPTNAFQERKSWIMELIFVVLCFFLYYFVMPIVPDLTTTIEMLFEREDLYSLAEKYGELHHIYPPMI